jgi:hypothetical protein
VDRQPAGLCGATCLSCRASHDTPLRKAVPSASTLTQTHTQTQARVHLLLDAPEGLVQRAEEPLVVQTRRDAVAL